ncbi:MAG: tetratricopeptide repeat protein [Gemmatimonadetes bacterium]|uniref:Tetratricopeptide repeat protein n=1 Tax=Candidatus Kutchimonas denitrificans TaxID=3056748 RepID=A0AAE5C993_9BACT|nr:tetratricopeptide repeat protein [Gemmatimonadota bacterium]NIR75256.1 tetratricopeptide repeat protein [Candidatus Kutchimonas denitrificans]NIS00194.1 tetratricopeptide repeat protein [Gemmatimonadota bacterium]NIT65786.1 tetratricopeptide repeat protein [Gemmatimonadota bacterium]NIU53064.1 tetratricopeptide repeat protein [Gemmatimonadota bacterium]
MPQPRPTGEDRFIQTVYEFGAWAQRNTRALVLGIAALAIIGFSVKYYIDYTRRVEEAASSELRAIRFQANNNPAQAVEQLRGLIAQYDGSSYAREGRVLLAYALLLQNRPGEAVAPAREAVRELEHDVLSIRAAFLLAAAYEEVADTAAAIAVYEDIGREVEARVQKSRALQAAARLKAAFGDPQGAARILEQLAEITPPEAAAHDFYLMRAAEYRAEAVPPVRSGSDSGTAGQ